MIGLRPDGGASAQLTAPTSDNVDRVLADVLADPRPAKEYERNLHDPRTAPHAVAGIASLAWRRLCDPEGVLAAIALPRPDVAHELPVEVVTATGHPLLGAIFLARRSLGSSNGFAKDSTCSTMPVVMDPPLTTRKVASQAAAQLPGVQVRRLMYWRYLLVWQTPVAAGGSRVGTFLRSCGGARSSGRRDPEPDDHLLGEPRRGVSIVAPSCGRPSGSPRQRPSASPQWRTTRHLQ
jgi:hypothetical protein